MRPVLHGDVSAAARALLVVPQPADFREVSATLTKNPIVAAGQPNYSWPAVTHEDLASTEFRVAAAPVEAWEGER